MKILGIESSCDETGVAIYDNKQGLLADALFSQTELHQTFGGVVPELASRDHIKRLLPLTESVLQEARLTLKDLNGIAYTKGPGLVGALMVGAAFAKALAFSLKIPTIGIHHMEGHLLAPLLAQEKPKPPFLALLVSGGHTQLIEVDALGCYRLLGDTLDDAVGEAFDKTAKLLGLSYPGGPLLEKLAKKGDVNRFRFPRPMTDRPGLDFSFSGLKTFAMNTLIKTTATEQDKADIAAAFQKAVVETMVIKCRRAIQQTGVSQILIAGGVSANTALREALTAQKNWQVFYPEPRFCTDNGAMIAFAGALRLVCGQQDDAFEIDVKARWPLSELSIIA